VTYECIRKGAPVDKPTGVCEQAIGDGRLHRWLYLRAALPGRRPQSLFSGGAIFTQPYLSGFSDRFSSAANYTPTTLQIEAGHDFYLPEDSSHCPSIWQFGKRPRRRSRRLRCPGSATRKASILKYSPWARRAIQVSFRTGFITSSIATTSEVRALGRRKRIRL